MLKLSGKVISINSQVILGNKVFVVSTNPALPTPLKKTKAFIVGEGNIPEGFAHYLAFESERKKIESHSENLNVTVLSEDYSYLGDGDVIRLSPQQSSIKVLFRKSAETNSFLITEQCNHYCLMCSQPPKKIDDSWLIDELLTVIPLLPKDTKEIVFSGGEPTLLEVKFLKLLNLTKSTLPGTALHILSNGRAFKNTDFTKNYAAVDHHDMMVGIPIYSDDPATHDFIVQAKGAFEETIQGILNLKKLNQKVEIRIVLHKQSIKRLQQLCEFIARNLLFVDHVALMGLEMTGFTRANLDKLWIDQKDYKDELSSAVNILSSYGMNVSVYNHQLCLINPDIHKYYRKSISDWKNEFATECKGCSKQTECGGFFSSGIQYGYSAHLTPFK